MGSLTRLLLWRSTVSAHSSSGDFVCMEIKLSLGTSSMKDKFYYTYIPLQGDFQLAMTDLWGVENWGGGCRQERQGVSVGGWNGPLRSLTSVQHHINNVHWQGYGLPVLRFSFRQCDFSPSFSSSIHGMLINASVACLTATAELFWEGEGERLGDYLRKVSLESCWEINHCSGKTIAIKCNMSERKSSIL